MIKVKLLTHTNISPADLASHAALICYQAEAPEIGKQIDIENRLFNVGHHTTLQHFFFTFTIENIAVSDITLGLHLTHPFYNSDQRSGRYSARMFDNPDFELIENYIKNLWPEVSNENLDKTIDFIKTGLELYQINRDDAIEAATNFIKNERPFASAKSIELNAPKIAQEQMRVFVSTIFPTALDFTVNLSTLAAIYRSAWTPALKRVSTEMVKQVLEKFPELDYMFKPDSHSEDSWSPSIISTEAGIKQKPVAKLLSQLGEFLEMPNKKIMHPVDLLHFTPEQMDNSFRCIETEIETSLATMGQDQRHRTIRRSQPIFTGNFYMPPITVDLGLNHDSLSLMTDWLNLRELLPATLHAAIAPYGAMVAYRKSGSINAIAHEQAKRLCWCAQEEIYHLSLDLRTEIAKQSPDSELLNLLQPPCFIDGVCGEGARYCGRDLTKRGEPDFNKTRRI